MAEKLRILAVGAHPDDVDIGFGGCAIRSAQAGHEVVLLSLTNGDAGHHAIGGITLARRRSQEARRAGSTAGVTEYRVLDNHDGELEPCLANRRALIALVREIRPDILFTHRSCDYHPDHRSASWLVQDAVSLVERPPVVCYMHDSFTRPYPFQAELAVGIDDVVQRKLDMIDCHESQVYEWLPFNEGTLGELPAEREQRRAWLTGRWQPVFEAAARAGKSTLAAVYGAERAAAIRSAEVFELSEYGRIIAREEAQRLLM